MSIAILGVNHKTAPVALREKIAFSGEKLDVALCSLHQHPFIDGCVIVSTCNRTELYISFKHGSDIQYIKTSIAQWLCQFHQIELTDLKHAFYCYQNQQAVSHLMRVACGIDSLIIGEPQILGQVKQAFNVARAHRTVSLPLDKLFQRVFHIAKRVRTETQIGANTASVAYAACLVARELFQDKSETLTVLLIGAGDTIELISRYLKSHHFDKVIIANRTREKALKLARYQHTEIISLSEIAVRLKEVDIVISSTASPLPIIGKGLVETSLKMRNYKPMLFIDLAVPRDIEAEVAGLNNVAVYCIDDLQHIVNQNLEQRVIAAKEAEYIIDEESVYFIQWLQTRLASQLIKTYRHQAMNIKSELETKAMKAIENGADVNEVITLLSHRLTNRLIHAPTQSLLHAAKHDYLTILSQSLNLKEL